VTLQRRAAQRLRSASTSAGCCTIRLVCPCVQEHAMLLLLLLLLLGLCACGTVHGVRKCY
jgi:hypothetical protein